MITKNARAKLKHCARCETRIRRPVLPAAEPELCGGCAMSKDPGSEIEFREVNGFCATCGGEHCPHYACTASGGMGFCDNCSGDD